MPITTYDEWLEREIATFLESGAPESFKNVTVDELISVLIFFNGRIEEVKN